MRARFPGVRIFDHPLPVGKKAEGFTLLEILVVIVIIGTLAALMIPALSGALERANTSKCASNLRQIGAGVLLFAGENSGNFPLAGPDIKHGQTPAPWTDQIEPYLGGQTNSINKIYICPSSSKVIARNRIFSYFLGTRAAYLENGNAFAAVKLQKIESLSKFILGGTSLRIALPWMMRTRTTTRKTRRLAFLRRRFTGGESTSCLLTAVSGLMRNSIPVRCR